MQPYRLRFSLKYYDFITLATPWDLCHVRRTDAFFSSLYSLFYHSHEEAALKCLIVLLGGNLSISFTSVWNVWEAKNGVLKCVVEKSLIRWLEGLGLKRKIKDKKTPPHYFMSFNDHLHIVEHRMINSKNANVMSDIPTQNPFKKSYFVI